MCFSLLHWKQTRFPPPEDSPWPLRRLIYRRPAPNRCHLGRSCCDRVLDVVCRCPPPLFRRPGPRASSATNAWLPCNGFLFRRDGRSFLNASDSKRFLTVVITTSRENLTSLSFSICFWTSYSVGKAFKNFPSRKGSLICCISPELERRTRAYSSILRYFSTGYRLAQCGRYPTSLVAVT